MTVTALCEGRLWAQTGMDATPARSKSIKAVAVAVKCVTLNIDTLCVADSLTVGVD